VVVLCSNLSNENFDAGHRFPTPSLGAKGNKLTYTIVKQENLVEIGIWATTLGYT